MIHNNKVLSLAVIGLVLGGVIGAVVNTGQANALTLAVVGGAIGFLAGWIWNTRPGDSND